MGRLTAALEGKIFAFDSAPLIYYLEQHPRYFLLADELFDSVRLRLALAITSILTLVEVLVMPIRKGRHDLGDDYRRLLTRTRGITLFSIDRAICERAARLRAQNSWLRTPDALQLATAVEHRADLVVTNDSRWKQVKDIQVVVLGDYLESRP